MDFSHVNTNFSGQKFSVEKTNVVHTAHTDSLHKCEIYLVLSVWNLKLWSICKNYDAV